MVYQVIALVAVIAMGAYLVHNTLQNMRIRGIQSGFDFITQPAGFSIGESVVPFDSDDSYGKAFLVGLSNTLRVAVVGIILATLLGTLVGIGRLSQNFLLRTLCAVYVEIFRNVPLLLQLFIWYFVLTELLPPIETALQPMAGVFFSKNGLQYPVPVWAGGHWMTLAGLALGVVAVWAWSRATRAHLYATGLVRPVFWPGLAILIACALLGWLAGGAPGGLDFIAEIVRGGIQAVPYGQHEAAAALGLSRQMDVRLVQLPQALRVIIPPLTSQYLNLTKNSSLAVAVGYPDLVSISNTSLNQTGRAIECIALVMACYLTLSLLTAAFMNAYNKRSLIKER